MTFEIFFFGLAVALTAVVLWLYITGRLESALDAWRSPMPEPSEQEREAERARIERKIARFFAPLDRFADRPAIQRIARSRTYTVWIAPALTALFIALNGGMIIAALFGALHWSTGVLSFGFLLAYLSAWRVMWLAEHGHKNKRKAGQ